VHLFRPSLCFLAEAQPRLANRLGQKARFLINIYILTIFLIVFVINLPTTMIGFVVNLLNRPTDGATVSVRKSVTFRPLVST
jgi:hypothetical protein